MNVLKRGQCLRHDVFGVGIAKASSEERTTIEFYEHGTKTFVTDMLQAELLPDAPPRPGRARSARRAKGGVE
jgi:hypothetical protein